jgi:hypothetical protein
MFKFLKAILKFYQAIRKFKCGWHFWEIKYEFISICNSVYLDLNLKSHWIYISINKGAPLEINKNIK